MDPSTILTVSIAAAAEKVYEFASDPRNLPCWATTFCLAIRPDGAAWIMETPMGPVGLRFAANNPFGVLDHIVSPEPGVEIRVPMRVIPNGEGSDIQFTLFRRPEMTLEMIARDVDMATRDLNTLKRLLESA